MSTDELKQLFEERVRQVKDSPLSDDVKDLLIGGATTSELHTALKIAPAYHAPVVHLKDASQNATVAARLMNPDKRRELVNELNERYEQLRRTRQSVQVATVSLEEAQANKLKLF